MPVPRRRHCSARRDRNRTHKKLTPAQSITSCPNTECGAPRLPHRICPKCGEFRGRFFGGKNKPAAEQPQA